MGRDADLELRDRINKICGYRDIHKKVGEILQELGLDPDSKSQNDRINAIIKYDRDEFHNGLIDEALEALVDGEPAKVYKYCLGQWYLKHRTYLWGFPDGMGTPLKYEEYQQLRNDTITKEVCSVVQIFEKHEKLDNILPFRESVQTLMDAWTTFLEDKSEEDDD